MSSTREREGDAGAGPLSKRLKVDSEKETNGDEAEFELLSGTAKGHHLPPSHTLLGIPTPEIDSGEYPPLSEGYVGISEYVGRDVPKIEGIIKQRFTDFLVFEVDLDGNVVHIKSLAAPESLPTEIDKSDPVLADSDLKPLDTPGTVHDSEALSTDSSLPMHDGNGDVKNEEPWPDRFTIALQPFLSHNAILQLKQIYLEGSEPPRVSDSGWGGRASKIAEDVDVGVYKNAEGREIHQASGMGRGQNKGRGTRGKRGGRGGCREDARQVLSEPISSKTTRAALHQVVRELFAGKLDSETDMSPPITDEGARVVIKWSRRGVGRSGRGERAPRNMYPPYIHFTLQKTNRDTQDAILSLSRLFHVNVKDISVAGTKDKRGVTIQRASLKRGNRTVEDVWKVANGVSIRKSSEEALTQRGERGVRIADLTYKKTGLELGMLKGNAFVITLRNVKTDGMETLDRAVNTIKHNGFINYYGMQRFGTAAVPTHSIGLAILQSDWHKAISLILQTRPGEHPDVMAAREAWLIEGDLDKALQLMPRRVVAERCILESYKKQNGDTRNAMGTFSTIPRNLRLMYVHAYQSYVWNAIVSERIRTWNCDKPIIGDLVFEENEDSSVDRPDSAAAVDSDESGNNSTHKQKKSRRPWVAPRVKTLKQEDLDKYTIFDVIMPLPGKDVNYPGGELGEKYREYLRLDGLDPNNFERKQKDYSLSGSYRKILHLPKELSWSILRYTDPDVPLAQSDEDKLLGYDPPSISEDGKFMALQISLTLGSASYATMALREITKADTSTHFQAALTRASEDQKHRRALEGDMVD